MAAFPIPPFPSSYDSGPVRLRQAFSLAKELHSQPAPLLGVIMQGWGTQRGGPGLGQKLEKTECESVARWSWSCPPCTPHFCRLLCSPLRLAHRGADHFHGMQVELCLRSTPHSTVTCRTWASLSHPPSLQRPHTLPRSLGAR